MIAERAFNLIVLLSAFSYYLTRTIETDVVVAVCALKQHVEETQAYRACVFVELALFKRRWSNLTTLDQIRPLKVFRVYRLLFPRFDL
jgi:hypothetical protein